MAGKKKYVETPLMKQYYSIKEKHSDAILLFRVGDFYETFGEDAIKAIAQEAYRRRTGARALRGIVEELMLDIMYELPELSGYEVVITNDVVESGAKPLYIKDKKTA